MPESESEVKSDNVIVNIKQEPGCQVKLDVFVTPTATRAAYTKAVKNINKGVSIPGFRKGKAPDDVVIKNYESHVNQEWRELVVKTAFQEALSLSRVFPLRDNALRLNIVNASVEEGTKLLFEYEHRPEVPSIKATEIRLQKKEKAAVTQEKVDQAVEAIRYYHAKWEDITERAVQEGDFVDLDIDTVESPPKNICKNTRFEVAPGKMGTWLRNLVIGLKTGESAEGMSEKEENEQQTGKKGSPKKKKEENPPAQEEFKPTLCKVIVKAIKKATLPQLDDDLAKKSGASNVKELKERVKTQLDNQAEEEVKQGLRLQLERCLIEKYPFELPASLVEEEKKSQVAKKIQSLKTQKIPDEEINKHQQAIEEQAKQEATRTLTLYFLTRKFAEERKIAVSTQELTQELAKQLWALPENQTIIDKSMSREEIRSRLYLTVVAEKAKEALIQEATIVS